MHAQLRFQIMKFQTSVCVIGRQGQNLSNKLRAIHSEVLIKMIAFNLLRPIIIRLLSGQKTQLGSVSR